MEVMELLLVVVIIVEVLPQPLGVLFETLLWRVMQIQKHFLISWFQVERIVMEMLSLILYGESSILLEMRLPRVHHDGM